MSPFLISRIAFSLPGMVREEKMTMSPGDSATVFISSRASLASAARALALAAGADDDEVFARDEAVVLLGDEGRDAFHVAEFAAPR